jgi:hypothetical protein
MENQQQEAVMELTGRSGWRLFSTVGLILTLSSGFGSGISPAEAASIDHPVKPAQIHHAARAGAQADYARLPLYFIENRGQAAPEVKFYARRQGETVAFSADRVSLLFGEVSGSPAVHLTPVGLRPATRIVPCEPKACKINYLGGSDPRQWLTGIPTYGAVAYREAYPGIDLKFYGRGRQFEYDLIVQPGADPSQVKFRLDGIASIEQDGSGNLRMTLPDGGELVQHKPLVYQEINGRRIQREGKFQLAAGEKFTYGFAVGAYDPRYPLIIDPVVVVYSSYLGGNQQEYGMAVAVDVQGQAYLTGYTNSNDTSDQFPTKNKLPTFGSYKGAFDVYVAKLTADGTDLVFCTYLGGSVYDYGLAITVDASENVYVAGATYSTNFPVFPVDSPLYGANKGGLDGFVTKINAAGNALVYSTYLGGSLDDGVSAIAADKAGNAYVTGYTLSNDFPTTPGSLSPTQPGGYDAFVAKINDTGSTLVYSTYLGGSGNDYGNGIAMDPDGNAYVAGETNSSGFTPPAPTPLYPYSGTGDGFVAKLDAAGANLLYFTFLGGSNSAACAAIALDRNSNAYVTGSTNSVDFPTTPGVFQPQKAGAAFSYDAFVTKINAAGKALVYSSFLGGSGDENNPGTMMTPGSTGIAVDQGDCAYVTGATTSTNFPTKSPTQNSNGGSTDAFVTKVNASGSTLLFSTYLGGNGNDFGFGIAVDKDGNAYTTGWTSSANFPLSANPLLGRTALKGFNDSFVTKIQIPLVKKSLSLAPIYEILMEK